MREPDLKALVLGELGPAEAEAARAVVESRADLRAEYERLMAVRTAVEGLPVEDPPCRIAFVSDPVVEMPWWERMVGSWPKAAFASACVLAVALVGYGWLTRPAAVPAAVDVAGLVEAELAKRPAMPAAEVVRVPDASAVKALEAKLAAMERRLLQRQEADMVAVGQQIQVLRRDLGNSMRAANVVASEGRLP
jgi:hypothetical protein